MSTALTNGYQSGLPARLFPAKYFEENVRPHLLPRLGSPFTPTSQSSVGYTLSTPVPVRRPCLSVPDADVCRVAFRACDPFLEWSVATVLSCRRRLLFRRGRLTVCSLRTGAQRPAAEVRLKVVSTRSLTIGHCRPSSSGDRCHCRGASAGTRRPGFHSSLAGARQHLHRMCRFFVVFFFLYACRVSWRIAFLGAHLSDSVLLFIIIFVVLSIICKWILSMISIGPPRPVPTLIAVVSCRTNRRRVPQKISFIAFTANVQYQWVHLVTRSKG